MVRTKMTSKESIIEETAEISIIEQGKCFLERFQIDFEELRTQLSEKQKLLEYNTLRMIKLEKYQIPHSILNKSMGELMEMDDLTEVVNNSPGEIFSRTLEKSISILNSTTKPKKPNLKKPIPKISDEESTRAHSSDRTGREHSPSHNSKRKSRSLSRSKMPKTVTIQIPFDEEDSNGTPPEKRMPPPASSGYGYVTPKVKPNTELTVLRRPKQGEVAISMQGSPLLVSGVITETCANVNIPLSDGRVLSLQPSNCLRMSQLPELDERTRAQLTKLRDNLNKVVELNK